MSLNRYAKRRDANEPEIVGALQKIGAQIWYMDIPADLLVSFRRRWYLVECKMPGHENELTETQKELLNKADAPVLVVNSGEDAIKQISKPLEGENV